MTINAKGRLPYTFEGKDPTGIKKRTDISWK
jgi:hypothetical protein